MQIIHTTFFKGLDMFIFVAQKKKDMFIFMLNICIIVRGCM